jgi:hypothetical protein
MAARILNRLGVVAAGWLLAGCGGAHADRSAEHAAVAMRQVSRCIRAHGVPAFPDPVVGRDGVPRLPDSAPHVPPATQRACAAVERRVPAQYTSTQPVSRADFEALLGLARCMRGHGVPDWPDPNALGEFPLDARILAGGKPLMLRALQPCARAHPIPGGEIHVVRA